MIFLFDIIIFTFNLIYSLKVNVISYLLLYGITAKQEKKFLDVLF